MKTHDSVVFDFCPRFLAKTLQQKPIQKEAATAQLPGFSGVPIKIPIMLADFPDKTKPGNSWAPLEGRLILLQRLGRVFSRNKKTCGMLGDST